MRRTTALAVLPLASALVLLGAACSSDSESGGGTTSTTASPAPSSSSTTSTTAASTTTTNASTSTTGAGTPACRANQLQGELGPTNAGAGQIYAPLILRNTSSSTCELTGFPGVSVLDGSGTQLGDPASREGAEGGSVVLQPGGVASASLHTTNAGIGGSCQPTSSQMKVYPPNQTEALVFSAELTVCGGFSTTTMVPGDTGIA